MPSVACNRSSAVARPASGARRSAAFRQLLAAPNARPHKPPAATRIQHRRRPVIDREYHARQNIGKHDHAAPRARPNTSPNVRSSPPRPSRARGCRSSWATSISTIRVTRKTTTKLTGSTHGGALQPVAAHAARTSGSPQMPAAIAPTQAPMPSTSRTRPRTNANSAGHRQDAEHDEVHPSHADRHRSGKPAVIGRSIASRQADHAAMGRHAVLPPNSGAKRATRSAMWPISSSRRPSGAAGLRLPRATPARQRGLLEAKLGRFLEPRLRLGDLADLAGQADLAEIDHAGAGRRLERGGGDAPRPPPDRRPAR